MRIAQVAPLIESVPPTLYGGTERVVSWLTEELVAQGHEVTLFASGDSVTQARLEAICPRALRLDLQCTDALPHLILEIERVFAKVHDFDVVHFHIDYFHFPMSRRGNLRRLTTLHGRLDLPDLLPLYREFANEPVVSISDSQRGPIPFANWRATIHHGLPLGLYRFCERPRGEYFAFLGRISPEKRADRAIEIAKAVGVPLMIAAKIDTADRDYFECRIKPMLDSNIVSFIGEIGASEKQDFLGNALALLFPIDWPEPFGLVMIEAMACGTPVIAFRRGSVPEIVEHGVSGYIVDSMKESIAAASHIGAIDRNRCRAAFERRFVAPRMAADYVDLYRQCMADA